MGYVVQNKVSVGQRIAQGIQGAAQGIEAGSKWDNQRQLAQQRADEFAQHKQVLGLQIQDMQEKWHNYNTAQYADLLTNAAISDDPKAAIMLRAPDLQRYTQSLGSPVDPNQAADTAVNMSKVIKPQLQTINNADAAIKSVSLKDGAFQKSYQDGLAAYDKIIANVPADMRSIWVGKRDLFKQEATTMQEKRLSISGAIQVEQMKANAIENKTNQKTSQADEKRLTDTLAFLQGQKRVGASGPYQTANQRLSLAGAADAWLQGIDQKKITPNSQAVLQLKSNIDSMISGGSGRSAEITQLLLEKTGKKTIGDALQYLTSKPQNVLTPDFITQYKNELKIEKDYWTQRRNQYLDASVGDLGDILDEPKNKARFLGVVNKIAPDYNPFPAQAPAPSGAADTVRVQAPNGMVHLIPASQVDAAVAAGGKRL